MPTQLRTYDIEPALLDEWLRYFRETVVPMHARHRLPARMAWVDRQRSRFVWVRDFEGEGSTEEQERRYYDSPERARVIGDTPQRYIRQMDVRWVEQVFPEVEQ